MYQFMHIEGYARSPSTKVAPNSKGSKTDGKSGRKLSVQAVLDEATRQPGNCPHVTDPQEPVYLIGSEASIRGLQSDIEKRCDDWKASGHKGVRKDTQVLLTAVMSYPAKAEDDTRTDKQYFQDLKKWETDSIAWLSKHFGDKLKGAALHLDEAHPHIHAYVITDPGADPDIKTIHPGYVAMSKAKEEGRGAKEQLRAFNDTMRSLQDDYFNDVGMPNGLQRTGPKRQRLTRAEYNAKKNEAKQLRSYQADIKAEVKTEVTKEMQPVITREVKRRVARWVDERVKAEMPKLPDPPEGFIDVLVKGKGKEYTEQLRKVATDCAERTAAAKADLKRSETRNGNMRTQMEKLEQAWNASELARQDLQKRLETIRANLMAHGATESGLAQLETSQPPTKSSQAAPALNTWADDLADIPEQTKSQGISI